MKINALSKLKWYCQMCEKQCRDDNGFKCHCLSQAHLRQMELFASNPGKYLTDFSADFHRGFMSILARYGSKRVAANAVYRDYIADPDHTHINSTHWGSLTAYCHHLGREGIAKVDEDDKGYHLEWIDRSPETLKKLDAAMKLERAQKSEEERERRHYEEQVQKAQQESEVVPQEFTELQDHEPIKLELIKPKLMLKANPLVKGLLGKSNPLRVNPLKSNASKSEEKSPAKPIKRPLSQVEAIVQEAERKRRH